MTPAASAILFVDKPAGITSHGVVARVRRAAGTRRVGHAGTLDPMATGLLVAGIGSATRLLTYLVGLDKEYLATVRLGASTTTDDAEGELVTTAEPGAVAALDPTLVDAEVRRLTGAIEQVPSAVSAIKVDGRRAYALARAGEDVALAPRAVTVHALEVLDRRPGDGVLDLDLRARVSSGTYIRALARDLGAAVGTGGHLTALRRTSVGPFRVEEATALDVDHGLDGVDLAAAVTAPGVVARALFPVVDLDPAAADDLRHGRRLRLPGHADAAPVAAIEPDGRLAGVIAVASGVGRVLANFPADIADDGDAADAGDGAGGAAGRSVAEDGGAP